MGEGGVVGTPGPPPLPHLRAWYTPPVAPTPLS